MTPLLTTILLSAISGVLLGLGCVRPLRRVCGVLLLLWLAAALPILFFMNFSSELVLLFYLLSAIWGLIFNLGGRPA